MNETIVDTSAVNGRELVAVEHQPPATLFRTDDPVEIVEKATAVAKSLASVIKDRKLYNNIQGREHVRVEGWTLLGSMLGVFPVLAWSRPVEHGWEARVEARTKDGSIVGASEAECLRTEKTWATRDDYAIRSMAQTRATSKALRLPLGFVMTLAGYDPTPLEEMPRDDEERQGYGRGNTTETTAKAAPNKQEAPTEPPQEGQQQPLSIGSKLSEPQLKAIHAIGKDVGIEHEELDAIANDKFQRGIGDLTRRQASEMIDALKKIQAEQR